MVLASKFNGNFKSTKTDDLMLALIMTSTYGSNAFCFQKAAGFLHHANDAPGLAVDAPLRANFGL